MLACLGIATSSSASYYPETVYPHDCRKPVKPFDLHDSFAAMQYEDEVRRYKQCIEDFVQDQQVAIRQHQQAAEDATDEWNCFVRYENF